MIPSSERHLSPDNRGVGNELIHGAQQIKGALSDRLTNLDRSDAFCELDILDSFCLQQWILAY